MTTKFNWREFMNGYRDPLTDAEVHARMLEEERAFNALTGGMPSSGSPGSESGERECGYREEGGVYAEIPKSRNGKPLEFFLTCVPVPIDPVEYRLHPKGLGVTLVDLPEKCLECGGSGKTAKYAPYPSIALKEPMTCSVCGGVGLVPVTHIFDVIGGDNYPNVADFIEESRRLGISRRLELEAKSYARLTSRSRLILLHKRAIINNPIDYYRAMIHADGAEDAGGLLELQRLKRAGCPKAHPEHTVVILNGAEGNYMLQNEPPACAALWWHDIERGESIPERVPVFEACEDCAGVGHTMQANEFYGQRSEAYAQPVDCKTCRASGKIELDSPSGRFVKRSLKSGAYRGYSRPAGVVPQYALGIFAIFPLVKITVIDPEGKYQDKVEKARQAGVAVDVERY